MKALVVIPTFNEAESVVEVLDRVLAADPRVDVLVVDDGSPDGTAKLVAARSDGEPRIQLMERSGKQGLGAAYRAGFAWGLERGYDALVEMDADLSHRPADLPGLLQGAAGHDLTIGSRYVPGGAVSNWGKGRLALSRAGNFYARKILGFPLTDSTSGFRAFRREALEVLLAQDIRSEGYAFQVELAYRAWRAGLSILEVPIIFHEREHGRSKISRRIVIEALWRIAQWGFRDRLRSTRRGGASGVRP